MLKSKLTLITKVRLLSSVTPFSLSFSSTSWKLCLSSSIRNDSSVLSAIVIVPDLDKSRSSEFSNLKECPPEKARFSTPLSSTALRTGSCFWSNKLRLTSPQTGTGLMQPEA